MEIVGLNGFNDSTQLPFVLDMMNINELKDVVKMAGKYTPELPQTKIFLGLKPTPKKKGKTEDITNGNKYQLKDMILQHKTQRTLDGSPLLPKVLGKVMGIFLIFFSFSENSLKFPIGGPCVRLNEKTVTLFDRVKRLFFLNEHQEHNMFVLVDLQRVTFPKYNIIKSNKVNFIIFGGKKVFDIFFIRFFQIEKSYWLMNKLLNYRKSLRYFRCIMNQKQILLNFNLSTQIVGKYNFPRNF